MHMDLMDCGRGREQKERVTQVTAMQVRTHVGGSIDAGDGTRGGGGAGYDIQGSYGGAEQCGGACGSGADPKVDQTGKSVHVTAAKSRGKMPRDARQNHSFVRVLSASWLYAATVTWAS